MKTFILFLLAAMLSIASPAFAQKHKSVPVDGCFGKKTHLIFKHNSSKHYSSPLKSGKNTRAISRRNKKFASPKSHISKSRKNPNHTKSTFRDGGFYSFRRGTYSAHIFNRKS